ncbi:hypothetical protein bthur0001_35060 [Bacillus thuringiensis serovar tochigiensis BGSC 4Y1]|nr:hypothetical protein bthur0001_35060 [Bacillus thuringiensis serovar tochigiensis BGSC 4Y1]
MYAGLLSHSISEVFNFLGKKKLLSEMMLMLFHLVTILGALALAQKSTSGGVDKNS